MTIEKRVITLLTNAQKTLATAESCTGGLLSNVLTNVSGSSKVFQLGVVTYADEIKSKVLKVPAKLIKKHGAVSRPVAIAMANQVRRLSQTDFGIGITGIAGPTGATKNKPVGLVFIAVSGRQNTSCSKNLFKGNRLQVKNQSVQKALSMLIKKIRSL